MAKRAAAVFFACAVLITSCTDGAAYDALGTSQRLADKQSMTSARWDDFNRANSTLAASPVLPSGQSWQQSIAPPAVTADLVIVSNELFLNAAGASYLWTNQTGSDPTDTSVEFYFKAGSTFGSAVGLTISPVGTTGNPAVNSIHLVFGPSSWSAGVFTAGALSFFTGGTGNYTALTAGKRYRATVRRVGLNSIQLHLPDGTAPVFTDTRISQFWGPIVLIEHYQPPETYATDRLPVITGYRVGQ